MHKPSIRVWAGIALGVLLVGSLIGCSKQREQPPSTGEQGPASLPEPKPLDLVIAYGSEKKTWLESEIKLFEAGKPKTQSGRPIHIDARALGSGEAMQDILSGRLQAHVFSPASGAYVALLNDAWLSRDGHTKPLGPEGEPLILSPVVIALWRPMAEALGWPKRALGWKDLIAIGKDPAGWGSHDRPEWGRFKLGHTHPEYSNSGLLAVLAAAYAGAGKTRGLDGADLQSETTREFVSQIERAVVHYGKSTGFFAEKMLARGPAYLSAAVLYENLVVESRTKAVAGAPELVCVYPVEGTFWSDHPFTVLDAPWVSAEHREAAQQLFAALRAKPAQLRALALGFRPADPALAVASPIDAAHGADPLQPQTLLEVPDATTLNALIAMFRATKKHSSVALVLDKSGSMAGRPLVQAKAGAHAFLASLDAEDEVALTFFDSEVYPTIGPFAVGKNRAQLDSRVEDVVAAGGTSLNDAVSRAYADLSLRAAKTPERIHALVVMTDGKDESSAIALNDVLAKLGNESQERSVRVFTLGYGSNTERAALEQLAEAGGGSFSSGEVTDIVQVYRDIASFF